VTEPTLDLGSIKSVNVPRLPWIRTKGWGTRSIESDPRSDPRFKFDSLDTLRYWYSDLLKLFPRVSADEILDRAEYWIIDRWGAPSNANWWATEPRKGRYDERRGSLWSHDHGSPPVIVRYGSYLEWNAMLCVVGEL